MTAPPQGVAESEFGYLKDAQHTLATGLETNGAPGRAVLGGRLSQSQRDAVWGLGEGARGEAPGKRGRREVVPLLQGSRVSCRGEQKGTAASRPRGPR